MQPTKMPHLRIPSITLSLDTAALVESLKQIDPLVDSGHQILGETPHIFVCGFLAAVGGAALSLWSYLLLQLSALLSFEQSWARAAVSAVVLASIAVECVRGLAWYARRVLEANGGDNYSYAKTTGLDKVVPIEMTTYTTETVMTTTTTTTPAAAGEKPALVKSTSAPVNTTPAPATPSTTKTTTTTTFTTVARGRTAMRTGFGMSMADWSSSQEEAVCAWRQWARGLKLGTQLKGMRQGVLGEGEEQRWVAMRW